MSYAISEDHPPCMRLRRMMVGVRESVRERAHSIYCGLAMGSARFDMVV